MEYRIAMMDTDRVASPATKEEDEGVQLPGVIATLGELQPGAVVTEEGVASLFNRCATSVKRAVQRGELPAPIRLFGTNAWTAGVLVRHLGTRLDDAAKEAERIQSKIARLNP